MDDLRKERCAPPAAGARPLAGAELQALLAQVPAWKGAADGKSIEREFRFKDYYETVAFVNATAWIANHQDHHPDIELHYNRCVMRYATHKIGGLSRNDFICAARVDALLE
jgi:4a-hydroxytetrahydrobiopterin dehydratase